MLCVSADWREEEKTPISFLCIVSLCFPSRSLSLGLHWTGKNIVWNTRPHTFKKRHEIDGLYRSNNKWWDGTCFVLLSTYMYYCTCIKSFREQIQVNIEFYFSPTSRKWSNFPSRNSGHFQFQTGTVWSSMIEHYRDLITFVQSFHLHLSFAANETSKPFHPVAPCEKKRDSTH